MNELKINYTYSKGLQVLFVIAGAYLTLYGMYNAILLFLQKLLNVEFYLALTAVLLGVILLLSTTLGKAKPLFKVDSDSIYINMPGLKSIYTAEWIAVKEVGIGISFFKFSETDGKDYNVDISGLKYSDLKEAKSKVIEICESKNIPYKNV